MKKIIAIAVLTVSMFSCSDDDSTSKKSTLPLVSKITISYDFQPSEIYQITYDEQSRIQKIVYDDAITYSYFYNEQNFVNKILINDIPYVVFHYNINNVVSGYEFGESGELHAVTYDAETNTYLFPPAKFSLNDNGDVNATFNRKIAYTDKKGAFANIGGNNIPLTHHFVGMLTWVSSKNGMDAFFDLNDNKVQQIITKYNAADYPIRIEVDNLQDDNDQIITLEY